MDDNSLNNTHVSQSDFSSCTTEEERQIPFCCLVPLPHDFQLVPYCKPRLVYNIGCLGTSKETCKKTIQIADCGQTEIDLHILKAKGCISFLVNIDVEPVCEEGVCSSVPHTKDMILCCKGTVCVDQILKCSVDCLPDTHLDCENVKVCDLQVKEFCEDDCRYIKVTGYFQICFD
ncbi:ABC transporter permease [Bacillus cereus]|uniref:ABC transporter permease n=1 Tax=Bacillus thuringiensis TaxID=1428 RepID=UPI000676BCC3|nr:ABC transporter permease [Bacillus thuringiensis]MEB8879367.1 ABC transporter permease [Bacillus cereus]AKR38910.1 20 kDa protein in cryB1 5'region [Bacillus thuringiensis serovar indiana]MBG9643331.1 ABC transporter permease [Bacillus thuringiensis]MBG9649227.1 ABC transporter permease [Bacillus thuringiensis]MEB9619355.1 ABC transporter permease [Bacillus cereus]